ncbi:MAG: 4-hydroxyphenylpyruvate dioxygenase [Pseudomonadota bacterium]
MGPFPHDAEPAVIDAQNPAGTDGFEFVEFAHPEPEELHKLFRMMGYAAVAKHKTKDVTLYRQGDVNYLVNAEPGDFAADFVKEHGPCASSMAWRVVDPQQAYEHAVANGAKGYDGDDKVMDAPAILGIGGSLLYFVARDGGSPYANDYEWLGEVDPQPEGLGFFYLDHLTHNVHRGNMDKWYGFYSGIFNFKEIRFFDIEGKVTGLFSRALTSPCGKIRIPINESKDETSQIEEYLREYNGEGIQHIAVATDDIYASVDALAKNGLEFMPPPPDTYYDMSHERVNGHEEPTERMKAHGILIDGEGVVDGGTTRVLLQIFSKTVVGPIFFEFIQRKGDDGFGEGNFKALFESIEMDQIQRGVLSAAE